MLHHEMLQFGILIVIEIYGTYTFESCRLDEGEHKAYYVSGVALST